MIVVTKARFNFNLEEKEEALVVHLGPLCVAKDVRRGTNGKSGLKSIGLLRLLSNFDNK